MHYISKTSEVIWSLCIRSDSFKSLLLNLKVQPQYSSKTKSKKEGHMGLTRVSKKWQFFWKLWYSEPELIKSSDIWCSNCGLFLTAAVDSVLQTWPMSKNTDCKSVKRWLSFPEASAVFLITLEAITSCYSYERRNIEN